MSRTSQSEYQAWEKSVNLDICPDKSGKSERQKAEGVAGFVAMIALCYF
jgi:hypothetical protein